MKRKCIIINSASQYGSVYKRHICVDVDNWEQIYSLIEKKRKRYDYIAERTLIQPNLYWDCYGQEIVNHKTVGTSAIKFFDLDNTRIYCKETSDKNGNFYIVCAVVLLSKKVQKNNSQIIQILETISTYEYEVVK